MKITETEKVFLLKRRNTIRVIKNNATIIPINKFFDDSFITSNNKNSICPCCGRKNIVSNYTKSNIVLFTKTCRSKKYCPLAVKGSFSLKSILLDNKIYQLNNVIDVRFLRNWAKKEFINMHKNNKE